MVDDLRACVEQETPSGDPLRLAAFADWLAEYAQSMAGGAAEIVSVGDARHVRVRVPAPSSVRPLLVLAHFDTVWPAGTLETRPFRVQDGIARGPGCFDMKAGIVQAFWAVRALRENGEAVPPLVFLCSCDEEIGSPTSQPLIEEEARGCAAALVVEPSLDGALKTARKGVAIYRLEVTGRSAHSGLDPETGVSAVEELARLVLDLLALADPALGTTLNIGVVHGGTRHNVVAAHSEAEFDARFTSAAEVERVLAGVAALRPHHPGARIAVTGGLRWPPMERTAETAELYEEARAVAGELGFDVGETLAGGASDGNFAAAAGAIVLDGLGPVGGGAHAVDEHVVVTEMPRRAALLARLLQRLEPRTRQ